LLKAKRLVVIVVYTLTEDHFVVVGVLKVLKKIIYATSGEKGSLKDKFVIFMPHG